MKTLVTAAALAASLIGAGSAMAQGVDARHVRQEDRIIQGERSGALTRREAIGVQRQQASIDREEARMRAHHGGRLTHYDRVALEHRENRASRHIYHAKHNHRFG